MYVIAAATPAFLFPFISQNTGENKGYNIFSSDDSIIDSWVVYADTPNGDGSGGDNAGGGDAPDGSGDTDSGGTSDGQDDRDASDGFDGASGSGGQL